MGNLLCKKNRGDSPISPVDRVIGRCAQICPQNLGKKKHFWDKQVLETSPPPLRNQPKLASPVKETPQTGWETATLSVPDSSGKGNVPPVAPPRKKRSSMSPKKDHSKKVEKNVNLEDSKISTSETNSEEMMASGPEVPSPSPLKTGDSDEKTSNPTQIISDVGNEKSDRFFGENLSKTVSIDSTSNADDEKDLLPPSQTAEKIPPSSDEVDNAKQIEEIADIAGEEVKGETKPLEVDDEMSRKINKETGNLIFALENQLNPQEPSEYEGQTPVVEEIIVPVKRKTKHVCDDETHLRELLHNSPAAGDFVAPKKPQRDFSKYKKSVESTKSQESCDSSQSPVAVEKQDDANDTIPKPETVPVSVSEMNEIKPADVKEQQSPPPIPPKLKRRSETLPDTISTENVERSKRKSDTVPPNMPNSEKILRRCLSSQSYLTPELVETIAQQANSLSLSAIYLPEDYSNSYNDGSGLVSPNYTVTKKRSISSQISRTSQHKFDDGKEDYSEPNTEGPPEVLVQITTASDVEIVLEPQRNGVEAEVAMPAASPQGVESSKSTTNAEERTERKLKKRISVNASSPEEISTTIQSFLDKGDISPKTVLKLLEDEFGDVIHSKNLSVEDKRAVEELRKSATHPDIENSENSEMTSQPDHHDHEAEIAQNKTATLESNAKLTKSNHYSKIPKLKNKTLENVEFGEKRRHSIDELESWFSPKSDNAEVKRRREASLPNCLDSPEPKPTHQDQDASASSKHAPKQSVENGTEHSSLLKFLEKERSDHLT